MERELPKSDLLYICSPYSGDIKNNIIHARKLTREAWSKGWRVICCHLNSAGMETVPHTKYDRFLSLSLTLIEKLQPALYCGKGWSKSKGCMREILSAKNYHVKMYFENGAKHGLPNRRSARS